VSLWILKSLRIRKVYLFIQKDGVEDTYIEWASFNYKKTKTEIIQDAIDKAEEKDITYKKYLSRQS